ncbi:prolyl-tRNA synthetase associated domain-containing protein [Azohydromonas aeria]|uniref:prolyl-tRNA synthetase associated domain-containing protein n=1 Tax=Azohydromonas aeria TaxID=2590212 RepID=UPI0012F7C285|nr:prolyl-tRNA synthetase associated domain-containing protein [Azohydromonas aeria]
MTTEALAETPTHPADALLQLLDRHALPYDIVEHEPVFTIADALAATPEIGGIKTKNVFLRDAKGTRHFLAVVPHDLRLDLPALARMLGSSKLSMGSPERLQRCLGITPGAVSVFALVNDKAHAVELLMDERVWQAAQVQAHPLRNTATVAIGHDALASFLALTGHAPRVLAL